MNFYGQAERAAEDILKAFQNPSSLPAPLAQLFIKRRDKVPCRKWSWRNQLVVALHGFSDARGFRQWEQVGRWVRKGERSFYILAPVTKKQMIDETTKKERVVVVGFRAISVFGLEQTEGQPLPFGDPETERWVESLPLLEVARAWNLSVEVYSGEEARFLGIYQRGKGIALGVRNLSTWCHEMIHAADDRLGSLTEKGQHWRSEIVGELGGAVLLRLLGHEEGCDLGGCKDYLQRYADEAGLDVLDACGLLLDRTCQAVAFLLDAAEKIDREAHAQSGEGAVPVAAR